MTLELCWGGADLANGFYILHLRKSLNSGVARYGGCPGNWYELGAGTALVRGFGETGRGAAEPVSLV